MIVNTRKRTAAAPERPPPLLQSTALTPPATHPAPDPAAPLPRPDRLWLSVALVLAACIPIYWLGLGRAGLVATEGHRAIPAWEMLDSGDRWLPTMFDRAYLRKPPGMMWAIAASSSVFGRTEFAARAVSAAAATLSAVVALVFARRWFGPRAGLTAGLAQALMPVWFVFARSAEIESLHVLACQIAVLTIVDLAARPRGPAPLRALVLSAALAGAGLLKGPAGAPVVLPVLVAVMIATRSARVVLRPALAGAVILAGAVLVGAFAAIRARLEASALVPVLQDPSEFAPSLARLPKILNLLPAALVQGLPVTGAVALAFWPQGEVRDEARAASVGSPPGTAETARALALAYLLAVACLMLSGVGNPRYALPALSPLAPLAGWAWVGRLGLFDGWRRRLATWCTLGRLWAWPAVALVLIPIYIFVFMEPRRAEISGKQIGLELGAALPDGCTVYADWLVEARPEVLHYARVEAAARGKTVRVRWVDLESFIPPTEAGTLIAARTDAAGNELARPGVRGVTGAGRQVFAGSVYKYTFVVLERAITSVPPNQ